MTKEIIFFDLETTGTNVTSDRIVQLSAIKTDELLNPIGAVKNIIINPTIPIPKGASGVHGITDDMVVSKPTFAQYAKPLYEYFNEANLAGFNITGFDVPLLIEEFSRVGLDFTYGKIYDSFSVFRKKEERTLSSAYKFYTGREMENAHDAIYDTLATLDIMKGQARMYNIDLEEISNISKPDNFVDLTGKLILIDGVICFNVGKPKWLPVKSDIGFARWMLDKDFPKDTKDIIKSIIN